MLQTSQHQLPGKPHEVNYTAAGRSHWPPRRTRTGRTHCPSCCKEGGPAAIRTLGKGAIRVTYPQAQALLSPLELEEAAESGFSSSPSGDGKGDPETGGKLVSEIFASCMFRYRLATATPRNTAPVRRRAPRRTSLSFLGRFLLGEQLRDTILRQDLNLPT